MEAETTAMTMNKNSSSHDDGDDDDHGGSHQTAITSRWNPTKEQINMLEGLYKQGVRTPSAEQIQQITSKLKVYGHIEGKNVFYWFQNHKARQRQKQKQENLIYVNRFLHKTTSSPPPHHHLFLHPPPPPPPTYNNNVICNPFYIPPVPQNDIGYYNYHQYPTHKLPLPGVGKRRSSKSGGGLIDNNKVLKKLEESGGAEFYSAHNTVLMGAADDHAMQTGVLGGVNKVQLLDSYYFINTTSTTNCTNSTTTTTTTALNRNETLALFPVHPTGVLNDHHHHHHHHHSVTSPSPSHAHDDDDYKNSPNSSGHVDHEYDPNSNRDDVDHQPFFDFFAGKNH